MQEERIYEIPERNFDLLQAKIEKLNKKAKKLNCEPITINVVGTIDKKIANARNDFSFNSYERIRYKKITITGVAPIINNWELIASCEKKESGTLIKVIPEKNYPEQYRTKLICEHCNSDRYRKFTFIVHNIITKEYKMVGKSCLKDFLGHVDPNYYAEVLQWLSEPDLSRYDDHNRSSGEHRIDIVFYLNYVAACIREKGWISRSKAKESEGEYYATADLAIDSINAKIKPIRDRYGNIIPFPEPNESDIKLSENALMWAKSLSLSDNLNDYLYNINLLAHEESIKYSDMGFVASIVSSYIRHVEKQIEQERKQTAQKEKGISDYVGEVKKRQDFELTYVNSFSFENDFGVIFIHKFLDNNGNIFIWKTNNSLRDVEQGNNIKLKGTIKDHIEYRGEKQTHITRCKVI